MDIPLTLRAKGEQRLVYGIPLWYRIAMGLIVALLLIGLGLTGGSAGLLGWVFIVIALFAALYEERWEFDAEKREIRYRFGLLVAARKRSMPFDRIAAIRLKPYVRGTLPGSEDEREENAAALALSRGIDRQARDANHRRPLHKKAYLSLICEDAEGGALLLNATPARKGDRLRTVGSRIAAFCGQELQEG